MYLEEHVLVLVDWSRLELLALQEIQRERSGVW